MHGGTVTRRASEKDRPTAPWASAIATAVCAIAGLVAWSMRIWLPDGRTWYLGACLAAYAAGGLYPTVSAIRSLRTGQLNVDLLMIVAAIGAAVIGQWLEGIVLLFLFSLSGTLEAFALYRTRRSIESLIQLRPREAALVGAGGDERRVEIDELRIGDVVRIKPGERLPVDGEVIDGETWVDESTLTGESEPIHKPLGAMVLAGTINGAGSVLVRVNRLASDTTIERIVHMVQEAQDQKTPTQLFVESWQRPYVIGVLLAAAMVFIAARLTHTESWSDAFYHAMVLLVAASPCAVVVGAPAALLSTIARAGRHGILFKGATFLETLGKVDVMAFDKTGTITVGKPSVVDVWTPEGVNEDRLLSLAEAVERRSEHPLAIPFAEELQRRRMTLLSPRMDDFHSHTGLGVHARVDGTWVGVGREQLFQSHDVELDARLVDVATRLRGSGQTALLAVAVEERLAGVIGVADQLRHEAPAALAALRRLGLKHLVILTGDHERVARVIAAQLEADDVRAGLMPEQKVVELRRLADDGGIVAMVGDGVNDAPALAAARVGIAMGGAGSDVALEVADVVLMRDDLGHLPLAVWFGRVARERVRQNMIIAFSVIGILVLASFFNLPLWLGVLGHEGSTVVVMFNGLRILWERLPKL